MIHYYQMIFSELRNSELASVRPVFSQGKKASIDRHKLVSCNKVIAFTRLLVSSPNQVKYDFVPLFKTKTS